MKATMKRRAGSEAELLDHATNNLLRALKRDMVKRDGKVDRQKLRKDGYSERLLDRLEQAISTSLLSCSGVCSLESTNRK